MAEPLLCWVANIVKTHAYGPEHEDRNGTKHFSGGTKVYLAPRQRYDGRLVVVGPHRRSRRYIEIVMPSRHVVNVRLKTIYDPRVIATLEHYGYRDTWYIEHCPEGFYLIGYWLRRETLKIPALPAPAV